MPQSIGRGMTPGSSNNANARSGSTMPVGSSNQGNFGAGMGSTPSSVSSDPYGRTNNPAATTPTNNFGSGFGSNSGTTSAGASDPFGRTNNPTNQFGAGMGSTSASSSDPFGRTNNAASSPTSNSGFGAGMGSTGAPATDAFGRSLNNNNNNSPMGSSPSGFGSGANNRNEGFGRSNNNNNASPDPYGRNGQINGDAASSRLGNDNDRRLNNDNSLRGTFAVDFGTGSSWQGNLQEEDEARKREISEAWRQREAEAELERLQQDLDAKRREIEKLASEDRSSVVGSSLRMAGEDVRSTQQARSEEARRWAAEEASKKTMGSDNYSGYQFQDSGRRGYDARSESDRIQEIYLRWCKFYGKEANESRFSIFADNLYEAERYASSHGGKVQLSAFADLTTAEYRRREEEVERWKRRELVQNYNSFPSYTKNSTSRRRLDTMGFGIPSR